MKMVGFKKKFNFQIKNFGQIEVDKTMMGPFRENFLDDIYFRYIPNEVFENKPHPLVIDIGANVGFFSLATFLKFPKSEIYSFEPHPYCFKVMSNYKQTFEHYTWNLFKKAVSDQDAEIKLNTSTVSGFTTMASVFDNGIKHKGFLAKTIKLDSFITKNSITNIDFIKIDCEGAEYSIIYNLSKDSFDKINSLCIETHRGEKKNQNIDFLNSYLTQMGFTTKVLDEAGYTGYIWAWKSKYNKS
jgi:FkbM family methyltransferase